MLFNQADIEIVGPDSQIPRYFNRGKYNKYSRKEKADVGKIILKHKLAYEEQMRTVIVPRSKHQGAQILTLFFY